MTIASRRLMLIALMILPPCIFFGMDYFLELNYLTSSLYKIVSFFPLLYRVWIEKKSIKAALTQYFSWTVFRQRWLKMVFLGIVLAAIYLITFFAVSPFIDFQAIVQSLQNKASINLTNLLFIGLYIISVNSLLEEFFWRGFLYDEMSQAMRPWLASLITGVAFSFHHVMFYYSWFSWPLFLLASGGLAGFAIIMNAVFQKYRNLFACWLVHIFADIAQIYIALKIFNLWWR